MAEIFDLEKFKEKNSDSENEEKNESGIKEISDDEVDQIYERLVHSNNQISKKLDELEPMIFDDQFVYKHAKEIINNIYPHCTICDQKLIKGNNDKVDPRWPLDFGYNICHSCEKKLPEELQNTPVQNLDHLQYMYFEEDLKEIMKFIKNKDRFNIMGHNITTQKLFKNIIKYIIEKDLS